MICICFREPWFRVLSFQPVIFDICMFKFTSIVTFKLQRILWNINEEWKFRQEEWNFLFYMSLQNRLSNNLILLYLGSQFKDFRFPFFGSNSASLEMALTFNERRSGLFHPYKVFCKCQERKGVSVWLVDLYSTTTNGWSGNLMFFEQKCNA